MWDAISPEIRRFGSRLADDLASALRQRASSQGRSRSPEGRAQVRAEGAAIKHVKKREQEGRSRAQPIPAGEGANAAARAGAAAEQQTGSAEQGAGQAPAGDVEMGDDNEAEVAAEGGQQEAFAFGAWAQEALGDLGPVAAVAGAAADAGGAAVTGGLV